MAGRPPAPPAPPGGGGGGGGGGEGEGEGSRTDPSQTLKSVSQTVRVDIANYGHVNASLLEGANGASDTYENTLQSKDEFISLSFALFAGAITQRLSQDDVTPPGVTVRGVPAR